MQQQVDEIAIINRVLKGYKQDYGLLVNRYQQYVFTLVLRYVPNREQAEELAQDVFVKAYKCLADFKKESKFSTWLYTIVHTTCLSFLRKKPGTIHFVDQEQMVSLGNKHHETEILYDTLSNKTRKQTINAAIKSLPEQDAQIITLFYLAEQSMDEIGHIMGITPNNAKIKLYRARQKLKEVLERNVNLIDL